MRAFVIYEKRSWWRPQINIICILNIYIIPITIYGGGTSGITTFTYQKNCFLIYSIIILRNVFAKRE